MRYDILTIFPEFFDSPFEGGILKKAVERGVIEINTHDIRSYATDKHRSVDDKPYGGGSGMVFKPEPLGKAIQAAKLGGVKSLVILTTPQGEVLTDKIVRELTGYDQLVIICGRYEGVDERVRKLHVDREISVGDYILSGGEYAACAIVDAVSRYVPGVLGNETSPYDDSFNNYLLEHQQYTRPEEYEGLSVPGILLSGNHGEIERWKRRESIERTYLRRPELLDRADLSVDDSIYLGELKKGHPNKFKLYIALVHYPVYNKDFKVITTAFTNLDVHDISRAARTYGVKGFYLIHPIEEQRSLVARVLRHWKEGPGRAHNPSRHEALELVRITNTLDEAMDRIEAIEGMRPKTVATDAGIRANTTGYAELKETMSSGDAPYLIIFGTGSGIAEEVISQSDFVLKPVHGQTSYNHLSVRSAAAIILDRLLRQ
ncbi:MAG: tRNA (guanosine(37)-N1)-methyltransferase TrmD [Thermodesulfobacteriota bacterium]